VFITAGKGFSAAGWGHPALQDICGFATRDKKLCRERFWPFRAIAALCHNRIYCRPLSGTIPKGRHLFSGWRAHDVRPLRGARQITADFYGKTKSPHPYGCGPEKL